MCVHLDGLNAEDRFRVWVIQLLLFIFLCKNNFPRIIIVLIAQSCVASFKDKPNNTFSFVKTGQSSNLGNNLMQIFPKGTGKFTIIKKDVL